ncbi:hypothetical protein [Tabrizicola sp.]|uniref:hypothetical protein n=1 Tax=Tabrizicola sp. TaxID=2005166 RepID=UPI0025CEACC5|nr:hypothetical protein [Tabrizicola sp.]
MTALARPLATPGRLSRLARWAIDATVGTLLCTGPVTALIALGWLTRRQGHLARDRFGAAEEAPGWLLGPREWNGHPTARLGRALGGLAANIRTGLIALSALAVWTLPFSLLWLGAWWAGWENSFNKGYEQALVGPSVFLAGTLLAALILPVLPFMLAHLATENRLSAAFELRRLRTLIAQAGWWVPGLMVLSLLTAAPFAAARGLITTATDWAPRIEDLSPEAAASLNGQIALALAALAFLSVWTLRALAARAYAAAAPRAAGLKPGLWDGTCAAEAAVPAKARPRLLTWLCYGVAMAVAPGVAFLILAGQFLDHAWWRWLFHPALTLPWAG